MAKGRQRTPKPKHEQVKLPCPTCEPLSAMQFAWAVANHVTPQRCPKHEAEQTEAVEAFDERWPASYWEGKA